MGRKPQENPQLDMTPMIDVVFELIIFFVVTLTESQKKDETIELEDGQHGVVLTPEEFPPDHMQIDIASRDKDGNYLKKGRISMGDRTLTKADLKDQIKLRKDRYGHEFPIFIRADFATRHETVREVMDACAEMGIWQMSIMAVSEDKTHGDSRKHLMKLKGKE
ncbi:MAG: biopolymer transporter ExbD [Kiritimatiellae bacterium]|nr:biopolymer transporter ExbD [Kiritimatiellia bacterium]